MDRTRSATEAAPRSRRRLRAWAIIAAAVAVTASVSLVVVADRNGAAADQRSQRFVVDGLDFMAPAGGRFVKATFLTGAIISPAGWLINQKPGRQCVRLSRNAGSCGTPVSHVGANQYSVFFGSGPLFRSVIKPNATIAGRPAQITRDAHPEGCPAGGTYEVAVWIDLATAGTDMDDALQVDACFGSSDRTLVDPIVHMIERAGRHR